MVHPVHGEIYRPLTLPISTIENHLQALTLARFIDQIPFTPELLHTWITNYNLHPLPHFTSAITDDTGLTIIRCEEGWYAEYFLDVFYDDKKVKLGFITGDDEKMLRLLQEELVGLFEEMEGKWVMVQEYIYKDYGRSGVVDYWEDCWIDHKTLIYGDPMVDDVE